jgi:hypothetical protein
MYESSQFNVRTYVQDKQVHHFSQVHKEQMLLSGILLFESNFVYF